MRSPLQGLLMIIHMHTLMDMITTTATVTATVTDTNHMSTVPVMDMVLHQTIRAPLSLVAKRAASR
jgi:hypothetical protein